jgi:hypothetical protein
MHFLIEFSREIWGEFSPTYGETHTLLLFDQIYFDRNPIKSASPFQKVSLPSFKSMDKPLRFTREVLFY